MLHWQHTESSIKQVGTPISNFLLVDDSAQHYNHNYLAKCLWFATPFSDWRYLV